MAQKDIKAYLDRLEQIVPSTEVEKLLSEITRETKNQERILLAKEIARRINQKATKSFVNVVEISKHGVILAGENPKRKGLYIFNGSTYPIYVKLGQEISEISFTTFLESGTYYELGQPIYTGIIEGMGEIGQIMITELT